MNYKKSLLSLVTVMALSNTVSADTDAIYVPLTNADNDSSWVLFGVNGFSDGVGSGISTPTAFTAGYIELVDDPGNDAQATEGLPVGANNLASLQGIGLTKVQIGVDIAGLTFEATEPVRSMYVRVGGSTQNVKFNYKASLEGKNMEIFINGVTTKKYKVTIDQLSTYANATTAVLDTGAAGGGGADLVSIANTLDYNFSNPVNPSTYDFDTDHQTAADVSAQTAAIYHFDSISQQWKVWNKNNVAANANDFTDFSKGDAYWGRVDIGDSISNLLNDNDGSSGLVLGTSGNTGVEPDETVYAGKLTTGWNMLAFDSLKPYIRRAATGLVVNIDNNGTFKIIDDTGVTSHYVDINGTTLADSAKQINSSIEAARLLNTISDSFTIKAFPGSVANSMIFISDKKFTLLDANTTDDNESMDVLGSAVTLTGANPYQNGLVASVSDINYTMETTSAYGEYGMILDLLTSDLAGTVTAAELDSLANGSGKNVSARIVFGDVNNDNKAVILANDETVADVNASFATAKAAIEADDIFNGGTTGGTGKALAIDTNFDGTADKVIVASTIPFYVRDSTFTRVFTLDTSAAAGSDTFEVYNSPAATIDPIFDANGTDIALQINAQADAGAGTKVYAAEGSTNKTLVVVTTTNDNFYLNDAMSNTVDFFDVPSGGDSSNVAKGAIKGAYSIDSVSKLSVTQHSWSTTSFTVPDEASDELNITINGDANTSIVASAALIADGTDKTARLAYFDNIVTKINSKIAALSPVVHGSATHNYEVDTDNFTGAFVNVSGLGITSFEILLSNDDSGLTPAPTAATDANALTAGNINDFSDYATASGDLASDVKFNAIYTPNYANFGPLYTMRKAGYDVVAMLRASTDMNASSITWDSIDLTRDENDWFINNEFNLFSINGKSGYWAYLTPKSGDSVTINSVSFNTPTYAYRFDNDADKTTANLIIGGQLTADISGLNGTTSNVYASVGGTEVQLRKSSGDIYTADVTHFAVDSFDESTGPISITVRATNGKGEAVVTTALQELDFDYAKPAVPTVAIVGATSAIISGDADNTTKLYVFKDYIPENSATRVAALADSTKASELTAIAGSGTVNMCANGTFGNVDTFRAVAADGVGTMNNANLSNQLDFKYATTLKGADVLTHTNDNTTDKTQVGVRYNSTCTLDATQPTANSGVSAKALVDNATVRLAYAPIANVNFTTNLAWTSVYQVGTTRTIQVQNVEAYAGKTFFVEDSDGTLYYSTFPSNQAAADLTVTTPTTLTAAGASNSSLVP